MATIHKSVLITGGSRGLGFAAAAKFLERGCRVIITSRTQVNADKAVAALRVKVPNAAVFGMALNLASLADIARFVAQFKATGSKLDVLVANAAHLPEKRTPEFSADGYEMTFATNHLGHFLLTQGIFPLLQQAAEQNGEARVVVVSSRLHNPGWFGPPPRFDFDDINLSHDYRPLVAYKNSKLANLWFTYELQRRMAGTQVTANALCPGFVPATAIEGQRGLRRFLFSYVLPRLPFANTLDEAVNTYLYVALDADLKGQGGNFYAEKREIRSSAESCEIDKALRLWQLSEALVEAHQNLFYTPNLNFL